MSRLDLTIVIPGSETTAPIIGQIWDGQTHQISNMAAKDGEEPDSTHTLSDQEQNEQSSHEKASFERPPVSPIDTEALAEQLAALPPYRRPDPSVPVFIEKPKPIPISMSQNSDAIALRSAITLLQMQRDRSQKDLVNLQDVKQRALADPAAFVSTIGQQKRVRDDRDILAPTLATRLERTLPIPKLNPNVVQNHTVEGEPQNGREETNQSSSLCDDSSCERSEPGTEKLLSFPLPQPQNVFRMPPINWAKYHVAGQVLDRMHEERLSRPNDTHGSGLKSPSQPSNESRGARHTIASPYDPLSDVLQERRLPG